MDYKTPNLDIETYKQLLNIKIGEFESRLFKYNLSISNLEARLSGIEAQKFAESINIIEADVKELKKSKKFKLW